MNEKMSKTSAAARTMPQTLGGLARGEVAGPALLLLGMLTTEASTASLLLNLEAVATAGIAWVIFRENVDRRVGAGFALILMGGIFLSLRQEGGFLALSGGAFLIGAACLCWGIDNNLTRKISGSDPSQIAMWKGLTAGSVNISLALFMGARFLIRPFCTICATEEQSFSSRGEP
jgi:drug/metabolite transporter (DMT)-like permease